MIKLVGGLISMFKNHRFHKQKIHREEKENYCFKLKFGFITKLKLFPLKSSLRNFKYKFLQNTEFSIVN